VRSSELSREAARQWMRTDGSGVCLHGGEKACENGECGRLLTNCDWIGDGRCEEASKGKRFQDGELHIGEGKAKLSAVVLENLGHG
jgi:hypothetical protein